MGYIGNDSVTQNFTPAVDYFNGNGSTTSFTLSRTVGSAFDVQAFIENVPQNPSSAFTVAGNVITFTSAPPSGTNNIYVRYTSPVTQQVKPAPGTVSPTEINSAYSLWNLSGSNINYTAGSVGVGVAGSSAPLDIQSDTGAAAINIRGRVSGDIGSISFYNNANSTQQFYIQSRSAYTMLNTVVNSYMAFATNNTEAMRIDSSGNLIGNGSTWQVGVNTSGKDARFGVLSGGNGRVEFYSAGSEAMRIDTSGNLLVNTTSSTAHKMTVQSAAGAGAIDCVGGSTNGYYALRVDMPSTNTYGVLFRNNGNNVGDIRVNSSSTSYNTSSDYRLKENITPMTVALAKVAQLKPCTYTWKATGEAGQGFIAHELQAVVPDAVTGEKDAVDAEGKPVYQGVDTSFLVATLTAAIQEQQAIIEDLKARIEVLEAK